MCDWYLQGDGNLVLQATGDGSVRWASNTSNAVRLEMQVGSWAYLAIGKLPYSS
jgi:hypothetical protein